MGKKVIYPVGEQSFVALRERGALYVDKTEYVEKLLDKGGKYFFLGRPRRFGKSLFLSMMRCFFEGRRELFKGLYADKMEWDWEPYPVLYLDLNTESYATDEALAQVIENKLRIWEDLYDIRPYTDSISVRFENIIRIAYEKTGKHVIILVDEYDKALVNNLHDSERFVRMREQLTAVYSNFKSSAQYIRMVFLTGVSRFAHLSVFSGLNNIMDISFLPEFSAICGITEQELCDYFRDGMEMMAGIEGVSAEEIHEELKRRYDGYHFSRRCPDIYNPYSLLNVMDRKEFGNFWIGSGGMTLLEHQLKRFDTDLKSLFEARCSQSMLEGLDFDSPNPEALLYQTGYLTIKSYRNNIYTLGLPNGEVKDGFLGYLLPRYANVPRGDTEFFIGEFVEELDGGDVDSFMRRLQSMFSSVSYRMEMDCEKNLHNALLMLMILLGMHVETEYCTSEGPIDLFVRTARYLYIIELKLDRSPEEALRQIEERHYALPFAAEGRETVSIGVNFSTSTRTITGWSVAR